MSWDVISITGLIGSFAFALSGFFVGARKQFDLVSVFVLCMLTANGGGAVRDILLNETPLVLLSSTPFLIVGIVVVFGWLFRLERYESLERNTLFILCDAIGLAAFSVTGAVAGIGAGLPVFGVMVIAFITATGGGIIRDVLVGEVPLIIRNSDFYGTLALLVALVLYALHAQDLLTPLTTSLVLVAALALRMVAYHRKWRVPSIKPRASEPPK